MSVVDGTFARHERRVAALVNAKIAEERASFTIELPEEIGIHLADLGLHPAQQTTSLPDGSLKAEPEDTGK